MPGMEYRLEPVPGVDTGGRLYIRGPNIMMGYLRAEKPGVLEPLVEGWHDTGDIVAIDDGGFVAIRGRAKRFAKIGGEMISLAAVETLADELWKGFMSAVVSVPDARKGEKLILLTDAANATRADLLAFARQRGAVEFMVPAEVRVVSTRCRCWGRARSTMSPSRKWCAAKISQRRRKQGPSPLRGRVAAQRPGGVLAAGRRAIFAPSTAGRTPSGASRHLPLRKGGRDGPHQPHRGEVIGHASLNRLTRDEVPSADIGQHQSAPARRRSRRWRSGSRGRAAQSGRAAAPGRAPARPRSGACV